MMTDQTQVTSVIRVPRVQISGGLCIFSLREGWIIDCKQSDSQFSLRVTLAHEWREAKLGHVNSLL